MTTLRADRKKFLFVFFEPCGSHVQSSLCSNARWDTRKMTPSGSDCHVRAHEIRSTTFSAAALHCQLALLICFANDSLTWTASTRHRQMYTVFVSAPMLSPILLNRVPTFPLFSPHIQHFLRVLTQTRDQPPRGRKEKRNTSTVSKGITVAVDVLRFLSTSESINALSKPPPHVASKRVQATPRIRITTKR